MASVEEVREEYSASLSRLTTNVRPLIINLTELANEYKRPHAGLIASLIEGRIRTVRPEQKMPALYLLDSIIKNHGDPYRAIFQPSLVSIFAVVFGANESPNVRMALHKLRNTWNSIFDPRILESLDIRVQREFDPKWPIQKRPTTAEAIPQPAVAPANIHINPAMLGGFEKELEAKRAELKRLQMQKLQMEIDRTAQEIAQKRESAVSTVNSTTRGTKAVKSEQPTTSKVKSEVAVPPKRADPRRRDPRREPKTERIVTKAPPVSDPSIKSSKIAAAQPKSSSVPPKSSSPAPKSPGRKSEPREAAPAAPPSSKSATPPPAPSIREEYKGKFKESPLRPASGSGSGSKKRTGSLDTSPSAKQPRDGRDKKRREREERRAGRSSSSGSSSSSPSPPPTKAVKSRVAHVPTKNFRIPKGRGGGGDGVEVEEGFEVGPHVEFNNGKKPSATAKKRPAAATAASATATTSTATSAQAGAAKSSATASSKSQKRGKLNEELFGDGDGPMRKKDRKESLPSPSIGWTKFKETNPDEFRTPLKDQRGRRHQEGQEQQQQQQQQQQLHDNNRFRNRRQQQQQLQRGQRMQHPHPRQQGPQVHGPGGRDPRMNPFGGPGPRPFMGGPGGGGGGLVPGGQMDGGPFGNMFQNMNSTDPAIVESEVIPMIIHQARESFNSGNISHEQFADVMRNVMTLKEQTMMARADRRHENKENNLRQHPVGPWENPPPGFLQQQPRPQGPPGPMPFGFMGGGGGGGGGMIPRPQGPPTAAHFNRDLPLANEEDLELIAHDPKKTISIDNHPREIRFYEESATCIMADNAVAELSFQRGEDGMRQVAIDGDRSIVPMLPLDTNEYTDFVLDGVQHKIRIGAPTRELWVDGQWYELYFDKVIRIRIGQSFHSVGLVGPPPSVKIGDLRPDLCAGYVQLIIDGDLNQQVRLFLDAKPQRVDVDGKPHVLRFADKLKTLLINGHPFKTDFGGVPMLIYVNGYKHFLRLSTLPQGVREGRVDIWNMIGNDGQGGGPNRDQSQQPRSPPTILNENSNPEGSNQGKEEEASGFDKLLTLFPSGSGATKGKEDDTNSEADYKCNEIKPRHNSVSEAAETPQSANVNVHNLFAQLLGAGLVPKGDDGEKGKEEKKSPAIPGLEVKGSDEAGKENKAAKANNPAAEDEGAEQEEDRKRKEEEEESKQRREEEQRKAKETEVKPIVLKSHDPSLKERQAAVIRTLYDPLALQCKNCGLRYAVTDTMAFSAHLDWHFRMKRRERDNARKAQSRLWYFERIDWIISEEIEDDDKDLADPDGVKESPASSEMSTVAVSSDPEAARAQSTCPICREDFDQFFKQKFDDSADDACWHYVNAVKVDDKVFHPACYKDFEAQGKVLHEVEMEDEEEAAKMDEEMAKGEARSAAEQAGGKEEHVDSEMKEEPMEKEMSSTDPPKENGEKSEENGEKAIAEPAVKTEAAEEENPEAESAAKELTDVKEEPKEGGDEEELENAEVEEKDKSLTDPNLEEQKPVMAAPPAVAGAAGAGIKFNITTKVEKLERRESVISTSEDSEFDVDAVVQHASAEHDELKPKLKGRALTVLPAQNKDSEMSGLCSIM